ncbi:Dam family site-specific DNA-(adenine-N6)-methyltransferase [Salmonella enterica subsp. diarizonae]|nr:Dam family site-specific DNA-(adenine-N6)-methyltransferase [Salmonella enterica]ECF5978447.1 Dam family site-specific DNA-(adenine-N6)-methyltransferase [Salmonella enterica subsp. arizonae]EDU8173780.1 Dam family site-specific DNA-(adenine-N6)-methyltransferase [Salmonella enterica subsp. arizonae serovar 41:z4,z23:-]EDS3058671.1 Dam family site-specific DNA-(adenine-N6)-methyltransferase [Salmonella enterica]EHA5006409.1 Dam family site-specific DNA-(adenine-N6)-methyltransferase [Salmone
MRYGSVCSGIEAASVAWESLGWQPAWFAEIEAFPSAVLATHWPDVTNLGDMTGIATTVRGGEVEAPDVLVGGTPCQAFSIAGLRNGLADKRGQLSLSYVELANAIDDKRRERGEEEAIIVWENVPGVLSSKDNAFGCFIGALAGESCELQPAGGKWSNAGCVYGPSRIVAWRVLDAQFFGVAQRRRRVFVVASARKEFDPAEVLFEFDSLRRDTPPRREPQTAVTTDTGSGIEGGSHWDNPANPHPTLNQANNIGGIGASNQEVFSVHGTQDPDTNHELAHTLGRNHGQENVIITEPYTIAIRGREEGSTVEVRNDGTANALLTPNGGRAGMGVGAVGWGMQVRRLTPVECERLQGFPDNHTLISWRGKDAADCPDGQRYKAIGNSMAVPVMRWIGERIAEALPIQEPTPRRWQRPFLKWAGGKYSLLPELERLIPAGKRLIEPFVGGGSVFLNSDKHERFLLADINADLINLYQMLAIVPDSVIAEAMKAFRHLNDAENYTAIREAFNAQKLNAIERAAAFLYINRHCFNGLMRYNLDGFFNVGWGKYKAPYFPEEEIRAFRQKSRACVFMTAGFERTLRLASDGDVVYCDPPYEPMPGTAGFTNYAAGGFSWNSQVALAESCVAAHQRGAKVFISNSTAPRVIELYEQHGFTLHRVNARRSISSKGSTRETANDIVASLGI